MLQDLLYVLEMEAPDNAIKVKSKDTFAANQWQHVLVTYDGSSKAAGVKLFVGGRMRDVETDKDKLTDSIANSAPVRIELFGDQIVVNG